jgi:acetyltransferase-like isoleucine patch superfamily enzyme
MNLPIYAIGRFPLLRWALWLFNAIKYISRHEGMHVGFGCSFKNSRFGRHNRISEQVILTNLELGDYSYVGARCHLNNVKIGKFCSIAPDVKCGLGKHPSRGFVSSHPAFYATHYHLVEKNAFEEYAETRIGHDVSVGANAIILDGVSIGHGAIIGANAVVTKDIPPYAIAVGTPAKVVRYRFSEEEIDMLLASEWWNQSDEWLRQNHRAMQDIDRFTALAGKEPVMK